VHEEFENLHYVIFQKLKDGAYTFFIFFGLALKSVDKRHLQIRPCDRHIISCYVRHYDIRALK
jgi:hypothetical protein